jgi:hypothetical protein
MTSRVVPAIEVTIDRLAPLKRLKSVDLPTFGRPTNTTRLFILLTYPETLLRHLRLLWPILLALKGLRGEKRPEMHIAADKYIHTKHLSV